MPYTIIIQGVWNHNIGYLGPYIIPDMLNVNVLMLITIIVISITQTSTSSTVSSLSLISKVVMMSSGPDFNHNTAFSIRTKWMLRGRDVDFNPHSMVSSLTLNPTPQTLNSLPHVSLSCQPQAEPFGKSYC